MAGDASHMDKAALELAGRSERRAAAESRNRRTPWTLTQGGQRLRFGVDAPVRRRQSLAYWMKSVSAAGIGFAIDAVLL